MLREYVLYWQSQALLASGKKEEAFAQLQSFLRDFPESVMTEQAMTSMAQVALRLAKRTILLPHWLPIRPPNVNPPSC